MKKINYKNALVITACIGFSGCASTEISPDNNEHLQFLASDVVACDKKDIVILEKIQTKGHDVWSWAIECDGKQYICHVEPYIDTECSAK